MAILLIKKYRILIGFSLLCATFGIQSFHYPSERPFVCKTQSIEENIENKINILWHWEDTFSLQEKQKIMHWLRNTTSAIEATLGVYPFDMHIYMHRRDNSREPVPWAHTQRNETQSVHFYIDPAYSLESFFEDWTAPHEISHLSIPFLGNEHAWFAEGYASFMQYQVMEKLGIYSEEEVQARYMNKINRVKHYYKSTHDLITVARNLRREYKFPQMYWGSASYFMRLDQKLKESGSSLPEVVNEYLKCCRLGDDSIEDVIKSWDQIIGKPMSSELLQAYQNNPANEMIDL